MIALCGNTKIGFWLFCHFSSISAYCVWILDFTAWISYYLYHRFSLQYVLYCTADSGFTGFDISLHVVTRDARLLIWDRVIVVQDPVHIRKAWIFFYNITSPSPRIHLIYHFVNTITCFFAKIYYFETIWAQGNSSGEFLGVFRLDFFFP